MKLIFVTAKRGSSFVDSSCCSWGRWLEIVAHVVLVLNRFRNIRRLRSTARHYIWLFQDRRNVATIRSLRRHFWLVNILMTRQFDKLILFKSVDLLRVLFAHLELQGIRPRKADLIVLVPLCLIRPLVGIVILHLHGVHDLFQILRRLWIGRIVPQVYRCGEQLITVC